MPSNQVIKRRIIKNNALMIKILIETINQCIHSDRTLNREHIFDAKKIWYMHQENKTKPFNFNIIFHNKFLGNREDIAYTRDPFSVVQEYLWSKGIIAYHLNGSIRFFISECFIERYGDGKSISSCALMRHFVPQDIVNIIRDFL